MKLIHRDKQSDFYTYTDITVQEGDIITKGRIAKPIEEIKTTLKDKVTSHRWQVETGGITLPNGARILTAIEDQNRINALMSNIRLSGLTEIDFKAANGWYKMTIPELEDMVKAIAIHLQQCFTAEKLNHEAIDSLTTIEELKSYDWTQHFPN